MESLDIRTARALALSAGAGFPPPFPSEMDGVAEAVRALGFVQIDTISVVKRAHEHILWSRVPVPGFSAIPRLEGKNGKGRRVVEYWAHAAAYLPIEEWRFCIPRMERIRASGHEWFQADPAAVAYVRDRVAAEGPLSAREFQEPMRGPRGWWDWKPAKVALEFLFHSGELVCASRRNFQKLYDLAGRQIPDRYRGPAPSEAELSNRHVERAAESLGLFTKAEAVYQRKDGLEGMDRALEEGGESGRLVKAAVEGLDGRVYYARRDLLTSPAAPSMDPQSERALASDSDKGEGRAYILSPFDPFLIDRKRSALLWDFDYSVECYVPTDKRSFGYFALPILYVPGKPGLARFAGLLDAKADRKNRILRLRRLRLASRGSVSPVRPAGGPTAPSPTDPAELAWAIAAELRRFAAFQDADAAELETLETDDPALESAFLSEMERRKGQAPSLPS